MNKSVTGTGTVYPLSHRHCYCQLQTSLGWPSKLSEWCCKLYRQPRLIVIPRIFSPRIRTSLCQRSYSPGRQFPSFTPQPRTCRELLHSPVMLADVSCQTAPGAWVLLLGHWSHSVRAAIATCSWLRALHNSNWFLTVRKAASPSWLDWLLRSLFGIWRPCSPLVFRQPAFCALSVLLFPLRVWPSGWVRSYPNTSYLQIWSDPTVPGLRASAHNPWRVTAEAVTVTLKFLL